MKENAIGKRQGHERDNDIEQMMTWKRPQSERDSYMNETSI